MRATDLLAALGRYARFCADTARAAPFLDVRELLHQAYVMGVGSLVVMLAVGAFAGAMLTVQGFASLRAFGTPELLGMFIALGGVREVFPLIGAGCVGAKVGSAVASEVATLKIGQQIDALEVMAVEPMRYLVAPRVVACILVTPVLVGACLISGLVASYLIATLQLGVDQGAFLGRLFENITHRDLASGMAKAVAFGALTGSLSCWHGYAANAGAASVGTASNRTVVQAMVVGAIVNLFISNIFYGGLL